jgi:hypothetical protein
VDDDLQKLYQIRMPNGSAACIGMDYSSLAADGSTVYPLSGYLYDAVQLMVNGIVGYARATTLRSDGSWYIPDTIDGGDLSDWITLHSKFNGTSGYVELSKGLSSVSRNCLLLRAKPE